MQTKVDPQAAPGTAIAPATAPGVATPLTRSDINALLAKRSELGTQMTSAESRAKRITAEMVAAPAEAKPVLNERLKVVNDRMIQLERDLASVGQQIANAPPSAFPAYQATSPRGRGDILSSDQITAIWIVGIVLVLAPIALAIARLIWRRAVGRVHTPLEAEGSQRLKRMEHAVDAMAIEVERISEGQRFLTQIFAKEPRQGSIAPRSGQAEPHPPEKREMA